MRDRNRLWFILILGLTSAGMLVLNLCTPMISDDYLYSFSFATGQRIASVGDIFPSLAAHAVTMNGRLVPHFFAQLFLMLPKPIFSVVNTLVYLALVLGICRLASREAAYKDWKLLLIVNGALFLLTPAFGQSFLWLTGSVNYLWCDTLMVWLLVPFADVVFRNQSVDGWFKPALFTVGALLLGDISENVSASAVLMMALCLLWLKLSKRKIPAWMVASTVATFAGWLFLMLVPAGRLNMARAAGGLNSVAQHFQLALTMWLQHGLWLSLAFLVLFFFTAATPGAQKDRLAFAMGFFLCSLACNFAMTASDYYPERAFTGSVALLILAYAVLMGAASPDGWRKPLTSALACGFALVMAVEMLGALPNAYNRYRLAHARVADVCASRDAGQSEQTTFGIKGRSRFDAFYGLNELTDDPQYFPNVYFTKYYGLTSIVVTRYEY